MGLRTSHAMQRQRYGNSMQKTPRNQEPAYAAPYNEVVAAGHEACPPFLLYDRKYDKYDTYYKIPTRQSTCHDSKFLEKDSKILTIFHCRLIAVITLTTGDKSPCPNSRSIPPSNP